MLLRWLPVVDICRLFTRTSRRQCADMGCRQGSFVPPTRPTAPAALLRSPVDGIVVVTKAIPITEQGDCVFVVGTVIDRAALL